LSKIAVEKRKIKARGKKSHWRFVRGFVKRAKSDADSIEKPITGNGFLEGVLRDGLGRWPRRSLFPEAAVSDEE
jgi:hypothetical protein